MTDSTVQETTARNYQYQLLLEVSQKLSATLEPAVILQAAVDGLTQLSGLDTAAVYLLADQHLQLWATTPRLPSNFPDELRFTPLAEHPYAERAIISSEPQLLSDSLSANLTPTERLISEQRNLRTALFVPLAAEDKVIGVFIVGSIAVPVAVSHEIIALSTTLSHLAALAVKNAQLYHDDRNRAAELRRAQLALQQKNQELEQLVYSVSHDLKSPLVTVKTFLNILRQDLLNRDQQQINEDLNYIDKAADKMQQLLDSLLQYSRISGENITAQTMLVSQLVDECLSALAGILQKHQVRVSTSELPQQLHGDSLHFERIWQNLIENAVKYGGNEAQFLIEIGAMQEGQDVVFYVRDNGMGIAPEHRERIFNLFSQLNAGSEGSGLGLALVKKIVSIYQGRIWVESAGDGKGSCFMFTLPGALIKDDKAT